MLHSHTPEDWMKHVSDIPGGKDVWHIRSALRVDEDAVVEGDTAVCDSARGWRDAAGSRHSTWSGWPIIRR
jgi:hypothetical protein